MLWSACKMLYLHCFRSSHILHYFLCLHCIHCLHWFHRSTASVSPPVVTNLTSASKWKKKHFNAKGSFFPRMLMSPRWQLFLFSVWRGLFVRKGLIREVGTNKTVWEIIVPEILWQKWKILKQIIKITAEQLLFKHLSKIALLSTFSIFPIKPRSGCRHPSLHLKYPWSWLAVGNGLPCNDFVWPIVPLLCSLLSLP